MSSSDYSIQRLNSQNLSDIAKLHTAVYGKTLPGSFFSKKYDTGYTGIEHIGFIAYNRGELPIAYYGVIPCFMMISGRLIVAAQSADTMTHPDYRNRGLFTELAAQTYELCKASGIQIIFGFPNQNSLPGFVNKLKWQMKDTMDCFIIPVNTLPLERMSIKFPFLKDVYSRYVQRVLKKYTLAKNGVSNSVLAGGLDGVFRNDDYLQYKTYTQTQVIQIKGVTVWLKIDKGMMIGDMTGITKKNFQQVMRRLIILTRRLGLREIQFHASPATQIHTLFAERYWGIPSFPVIFKGLGIALPKGNIKFTFADIDIF